MTRNLFFELHDGLPREGPGDDATTARVLALIAPSLPPAPEILDIGCGPGAQTMVLARNTTGRITAVDTHRPFLDRLSARAESEGLADRISIVEASMTDLPFEPESFDVIWSEGAIWIMGFDAGLTAWSRLVRPGGHVVVSELTWLAENPLPEERQFWQQAYPGIRPSGENRSAIERAGLDLLAEVPLPHSSWFEEYLNPLEQRLDAMESRYAGDESTRSWFAEQRREIDIARRFRGFGYVLYAMRKRPRRPSGAQRG